VIGDIFQPTHLLFLLVIVLLVLGPKRLPEMARSLGRGFRDFRDAISGEGHSPMHELDHQPIEPTAPPAAATRSSAQRPVAGSAQMTPDPMAAPDPEVATAPAPTPDPVAASAPAPAIDPVADPNPDIATAPASQPVASPASKGPGEGSG
jgi:sec-independent protein translocase protein TatA